MDAGYCLMKHVIGLLLSCVVIAGCSPISREDMTKEALKADPDFSSVLEKHHSLLNRIQTYERELALKRTKIDRSIPELRRELTMAMSNAKTKIESVQKQMEPDRARLELDLSMAGEEIQAKRLQRANLNSSISKRKNALKRQGAGWTKEERTRQETQIEDMIRDVKRLDQELVVLKSHLRLLRIKLILIKI